MESSKRHRPVATRVGVPVYCVPVSRRHALLLWIVLGASLGAPSPTLASSSPAGAKADAEPSAVSHETRTVEGTGGLAVFQQRWRPTKVRGVLFVIHGLADHGGRYDAFARRLAAAGIAVYAIDHRGFGRSEGERSQVERFTSVFADIDTLVAWATEEPAAPRFFFGHSMGGAIATRYVLDHLQQVSGLVLSGAALAIDEKTRPGKVELVRKLSVKHPDLRVHKLKHRQFAHDKAVIADMRRDPLVDRRKIPARTAAEIVDSIDDIAARAPSLTVPLLVMHGSDDRITPPAGSKALVGHAGAKDKTLRILDGMLHDILHDFGHEAVEAEIEAWILARCPPDGGAGADEARPSDAAAPSDEAAR